MLAFFNRDAMLRGKGGRALIVCILLAVLCLNWFSWFGAPSFTGADYTISRGKADSPRIVSQAEWWISLGVMILFFVDLLAAGLIALANLGNNQGAPVGRTGRLAVLLIVVLGLLLAVVGTCVSPILWPA